jgi:diguanylate cyclase (GGDEF)-like protein
MDHQQTATARIASGSETGVPSHSILRCRRSKKVAAVLFADLDRFKAVNDTYGHHIGDELLQAVAERLTALLRPGDTLARLAGDEFVILCEDLDNPSQVEPIAARIDLALSVPFVVSGIEVRMSASVGIAFAGQGGDGSETVLQDADVAMYQAKHQGGARHGVVDLRKRHLANHRARLNRDLQGALGRGELRTAYQPIVSTPDERILGAEALLRWHHPAVGMVAPQTAVPLAEMSGLITEIGRWVLERACLDRQTWPRQSDEPLAVAVNVSASQLMGAEFVGSVAKVLADSGTDPGVVMLEITEGLLIQDSDRALVVLSELKRLGVTLALDDFGTGYSSLDHLPRFPVDIVKIDQAFISQVDLDRTSSLIVTAMVTRAHELGMRVVAEGVESADQRERVVSLDCDAYQGFHFARPMPTGELGPMMAASQL